MHRRIPDIRATGENRPQLASRGGLKIHAILAPVVAILNQFELLPEQGMKGMGYAEMLLFTVDRRVFDSLCKREDLTLTQLGEAECRGCAASTFSVTTPVIREIL